MDTWGFALIALFGLLWLFARKSRPKLATFAVLMVGVGAGIVVGAVGSYMIVASLLP